MKIVPMTSAPIRNALVLLLTTLLAGCAQGPAVQAQEASGSTEDGYTEGRASRDGRGKFYMGRELSKTMTYHGIPWLERTERDREERPDEVVAAMKLQSDDVVVDLGAGSGYFTFRIAAKVPNGKVLAVDIQPEMLAFLEQKRDENGMTNVETVLGSIDNPNLSPGVDAVLMVDAYHELSHPREIMQAVVEALVPGGRVFLVEYRGEDPSVPIKPLHKMTETQARKEMTAAGLEWVETLDFLPSQHFMVFKKPMALEKQESAQ